MAIAPEFTRPPVDRTARRSRRIIIASALSVSSVVLAVTALVSNLSLIVVLAIVAGTGLGLGSALTMHREILDLRRRRGADRVQAAQERRDDARRAAAEHMEFADLMGHKISERQNEVDRLRGVIDDLQVSLTEATTSRAVVVSERDALRVQLSQARAELVELQTQLSNAQDAEFQARAALLQAEQRDQVRRSA